MTRPIARPTASTRDRENAWIEPDSRPLSAPKDSVSLRSSRVSAAQLARISADLGERDRLVLTFLSEVRIATGGQLVRQFWPSDSQAHQAQARAGRRALKRLREWRVLDTLPRPIGGVRGGSDGLVHCVGTAGSRLLAQRGFQGKRLGTPGDRYIAHTLAITELVVMLHEAAREGQFELIEVQTEPWCWRGFLGPMGARLTLKPDLFVRVGVGAFEDRWFVEVDLATEARGTLLSKTMRYLAHYRFGTEQREHGVYPRVLWAVRDDLRAEQITAVMRALPAEARRLHSVCRLDVVAARLAAEAQS